MLHSALGPGAGRGGGDTTFQAKKRAGRSWKSSHSEHPRENTGAVSRDLSSWGGLRLRLLRLTRPQGRARPQSLSLSSLRAVWLRFLQMSGGRLGRSSGALVPPAASRVRSCERQELVGGGRWGRGGRGSGVKPREMKNSCVRPAGAAGPRV